MLRPERMSRVSVAGSKPVMDDVVEAVHSLHLVHLSDYDGSWDGFTQGDPAAGAEEASEKLVTIRALKSILGVGEDDGERDQVEDLEGQLETVRTRANDLDDRRSEVEDELRDVEEQIEALEPFVALDVDLDLLTDYETLETAVGLGDADAVRSALGDADGIAASEVVTADEGRALAVFVRPEGVTVPGDEPAGTPLDEALVGVDFERLSVPDHENPNPELQRRQLENRREQLQSRLDDVESEVEELREEYAGFLLAAEERLAIRVQKAEAPLSFATTANSFVAEGWIPTDRVTDLESALETTVGDRVEVEELEVASYDDDGIPEERDPVEEDDREIDPDAGGTAGDRDGEPTPAPDGGSRMVTMRDAPPTMLNNPTATEPMEVLVEAFGRPKYTEFDPTALIFLTFPAFFGFMIGDLGYGILYVAIGYGLYSRFDGAVSALGGLGMWAGFFTAVFGVLYGEFFGLHALGDVFWPLWGSVFGGIPVIGVSHTPIHKGLQPEYEAFATGWLMFSLVVGLAHVGGGYVLGFAREWNSHGLQAAVFEKGSWLALMFGVWGWIFSTHLQSAKPQFLFEVFASGEAAAIPLGFTGLPAPVGLFGLGLFAVGAVGLVIGEGLEAIEVLQSIVNVLSYARLMAVLLAKAGLAFVVNLLAFGAVETEKGAFHFILIEGYANPAEHGEVMFAGLMNADGLLGPVGFVAGLLLLVVGHAFVFALGITSAGLQGVRLEYVEFFGKFYDGGGRRYEPFGHVRDHTNEN